jgi:hypothetical protein
MRSTAVPASKMGRPVAGNFADFLMAVLFSAEGTKTVLIRFLLAPPW